MDFPRLLFEDKKTARSSKEDVITDLKLDLLFLPEVSDYFLLRPEKNSLLLRREMFAALLSDPDSLRKIDALTELLDQARDLYTELIAAESSKAADYIFVHLFAKTAEFCKKAEELPDFGKLFKRFKAALSDLASSENFLSAEREAEKLVPSLLNASVFTLKTDGKTSSVTAVSEENMTSDLRQCAAELEIPLREKLPTPFALQKSVADGLSSIYPSEFAAAAEFTGKYRSLISGEIFEYIPELKFISGIIDFTRKAENAGIPHCFPELSEKKSIRLKKVYDITLLKKEGVKIVPNDAVFTEEEPFFYLTGANGGGKTTYLRAVGEAVLMFLAGAPVFCESGECSLLSAVFTHFPKDERFEGTGRFLDEKNRVEEILSKQDGNSLILLNETYSTTGEEKAAEQTAALAGALYSSGNFGLYITHQHDISENIIPFLGVIVDESDSNKRTYRIEKKRLPPKSFAGDILEKYGLDGKSLRRRFGLPDARE